MRHSIRLRLFDWLRHFIDHVAKKPVKGLSSTKVNAVSSGNLNDRFVVGVHDRLAEAQINNAVVVPKLRKHVDVGNRHSAVSYLPPVGPDCQLATAFHNNLIIRHQKPPVGKIYDVSTVNRRMSGVES